MVRSYLRHGPTQAFGLICSTSSNSIFDGKLAYVPALEDILVWDIKKSQMLAMWHDTGHRAEVTSIAASRKSDVFAVGYADGSIRLWDAATGSVLVRFNGHKKAVTALSFDAEGLKLASGSQDTDIILWDIVGAEGIKRLSGHRGPITAIHFLPSSDLRTSYILSASKDTYLKLWDLNSWHCVETVVGHKSEVWDLSIHPSGSYAVSGSAEGDVKAWSIDHAQLEKGIKGTDSGGVFKAITPMGTLPLASSHRVSQIMFHPHHPFLAIQSHENSLELFRIRTEDEVKKKLARREKRRNEKAKNQNAAEQTEQTAKYESSLTNTLAPYCIVRPAGKIRSFSFPQDVQSSSTTKNLTLFVALASNSLELLNIPLPPKSKDKTFTPEASRACILDLPGHRTDIRALALSEDDALLASCSNGQVKIWNMKTISCIRTIECGYALCCTFLPGDKYLAVGTKKGHIHLLDIRAAAVIEVVEAHEGAIWSLHLKPDRTSLASGSADKLVKFWEIKSATRSETGDTSSKPVSLVHVRTLKLANDVLAVRFSPNNRYLAVATLDSTVQIFYQDTLKFYLSLYGHKLPVLSMDISHDSKLLVTCSADKNIKIWGLDFGDCHRSLFAHDESVMQVAFEAQSHYFWSVGKDGLLKYWDGDKFVNIQKLEGHHSEVWALSLSHEGKFVVTASHDKSIRVWEKLDEPLFLEEERERELEQLHDLQIADSMNEKNRIPGESDAARPEATAVSKQSLDTLMAGERLVEALDTADAERTPSDDYEKVKSQCSPEQAKTLPLPQRNAVLAAYDMDPTTYVLTVLEKIQPAALTDALLILPFSKVPSLLQYLEAGFRKGWDAIFISRVLFFILRTFNHQIAANSVMRTTLIPLRNHIRQTLQEKREMLIYNISALKFIRDTELPITSGFDDNTERNLQVGASEISGTLKRKRIKV